MYARPCSGEILMGPMQVALGDGGKYMLGHAWVDIVGTHARGTAGRGGGQCMLEHAGVKS